MSLSELGKKATDMADKAADIARKGREGLGNQIGGEYGSDIKYGTKINTDKFTKMSDSDIDHLSKSQVRSLSGTDLNTLASSPDQATFERLIEKHGDKLSGKQIRDLDPNTLDKVINKYPLSEWTERQAAGLTKGHLADLCQQGRLSEFEAPQLAKALNFTTDEQGKLQPRPEGERQAIVQSMDNKILALDDKQLQALGENVEHLSLQQIGYLADNNRLNGLGDTVQHLNQPQLEMMAFNGNFAQLDAKYIDQALNHNTTGIDQKQIILRMEKIEDFTPDQLQALKGNVEYLDQAQLQALGNNVNDLDGDQLKALGDNIRYLEQDKIEFLAQNGRFSDLTSTQIKDVLTSSKDETGLESDRPAQQREAIIQAMGDHMVNLDGERLRALKDNVQYIESSRLSDLADTSKLAEFDATQLRQALDGDKIKNPRSEAKKGDIILAMRDEGVQQLNGAQIQALDTDIKYLTETQLKSLGDDTILYLKQNQLETLATEGKFHELNVGQIDQVLKYTKDSYGVQTIRNANEQKAIVEKIKDTDITQFKAEQIKALGDSVAYLDKTQIQALDKNIVHLTDTQIKQLGDNVQYLKQDQLVALATEGKFSDFKLGQLDKALHSNDNQASIKAEEIIKNIKDVENLSAFQLTELKNDVQYLQRGQLETLARAGKFAEFDPGQLEKALSNPALTNDDKKAIVGNIAEIEKLRGDQLRAIAAAGKFQHLDSKQITTALDKNANKLTNNDKKKIVESIKDAETLNNFQLKALGKNIASLKETQMADILASRTVEGRATLIKDLGPNIQYLSPDRIEQLFTSQLTTATDKERAALVHALGKQLGDLKGDQLKALGDKNATFFTSDQLKTLTSNGRFADLSAKQIDNALNHNVNPKLDKQAIVQGIQEIEKLDKDRLQALGDDTAKMFTNTQLKDLAANGRFADLSPKQIDNALNHNVNPKLDKQTIVQGIKEIEKLDKDRLQALGDDTARMFTNTQLKDLAANSRFADLSPRQIDNALNHNLDPKLDAKEKEAIVQGITNIEKLDGKQLKAMGENLKHLTPPQADTAFGAGKSMAEKTLFVEVMGEDIKHLNADSIGKLLNNLPGTATDPEKKALVQKMDIHVAKLKGDQLKALGDNNVQFLEQKQLVALAQAGGFHEFTAAQIEKAVDKNVDPTKIDKQKIMEAMRVDDIALLKGEQLRNLGDNIQYFNKEQLQAISIAEDKSVTPPIRHIRMITAASLQSLGRKIEYLKPEQIEALGTRIAALTDQQLKVLTPEQVAKLTNSQLDRLIKTTPAKIEQFGKKQMAGLTPEHIGHLRTTIEGRAALDNFRGNQISGLQENAFKKYVEYREVGSWSKEQRAGLTREQMGWLDKKQLTSLTSAQMGEFTRQQLRGIRPEQMQLLGEDQLRGLTGAQIKEMTPQQIAGLTPDQLGKLNIADQILSLRAAHLSVLSEAQLHGLGADQIGALTSVQWKGISAQQIKWLRPDQVTEITPERLTRLTEPQIKAFTREQRKAMDSEQREAIKETKAKFKQAPKGGVGGPINWGGGFDIPDLPPPPMLDPRYADLFKPREMTAEDRQALNNINTDASLTPEDKKAAKAAFMREWEVLGRDARAGAMKEYEKRLDMYKTMKVEHLKMQQKFMEMKEEQRFKQGVANQQIKMMLFNAIFAGVKSPSQGMMKSLTM